MGKYLTFILIIFFISDAYVKAQNSGNKDFDALKEAYHNIRQKKYAEAYPYFKSKLNTYPKDPTYNYFVGQCLLFMESNPSNALKYLRFAATKDVPDDVYYYLGLAYLKSYEFEKALENFKWFEKRASKSQMRDFQVKSHVAMAENAIYLVKYARIPSVYSKELYSQANFYKAYKFDDLEGDFKQIDNVSYSKSDTLFVSGVSFVPENIQRNEVLYISAKNKKKGDLDIYRITRLNDTAWSEPENLGDIINTPFDECYPYLHPDGTTLYFASKGHYSMGGYDLYQSTWDWKEQKWSEPENLDFPINSPFDDILFVPSLNKKTAYFASNRQIKESEYYVYKIKLDASEPYVEIDDQKKLPEIAQLKVNIIPDKKDKKEENTEQFRSSANEIVKIKNSSNIEYKTEYDSLLNLAMNYQLKADSMRWLINDKRVVFDNTEEGQDRAKIGNEIVELERKIYTYQKKADVCYEKVRQIEQANLANKKTIYENKDDRKEVKEALVTENAEEQKFFYEPAPDSLKMVRLEQEDNTVEEESSNNASGVLVVPGLLVKNPSVYNSKNPIPVNEKLPGGIIYMIQLGAFSTPKAPEVFKGLNPLSAVKNADSKVTKYFAGKFYQLKEAEKSVVLVKNKGFKDAYIVAFNNGKIIPINTAVKLESKNISEESNVSENQDNEIKPESDEIAIVYILKSSIDINNQALIDQIKGKVPADKEIYTQNDERFTGIIIKTFKTYDEILPLKKQVESITKMETEIHAFFGENQIPVEQAVKITK